MKGIVLVKQKYRIGFSVSKQKESPVKETWMESFYIFS
jgi:hypothetical protein